MDDPQCLDAAIGDRIEHLDCLEAVLVRQAGRVPEGSNCLAVLVVCHIHVAGEHIRQPADLAPAHGIGLAGDRKRPHARPADPPGGQVAIDDGIDLVAAGGGLVDALRIDRDDLLGAGEEIVEARDGQR